MKNDTLSRKASNTMKKDAGLVKPVRKSDQSGDGEDFSFNGQMGDGVNRAANRFAGNQSGLSMKENFGRGPTKGNIDRDNNPRTLDKVPFDTAAAGGPIAGTRKWNPSAGQNYVGNPDKINVGMKK